MTEDTHESEFSQDEKLLFEEMLSGVDELSPSGVQRREFIKQVMAAGGGMLAIQLLGGEDLLASALNHPGLEDTSVANIENAVKVSFKVNGTQKLLNVDSRMTLLDALRERLQLTGSKKGCDHGQCGACTLLVNGRRVLSCLTLAATCEGKAVTTIEGLAKGGALHPVQAAFLKHDGFQCGYCTPGQICSAVALMTEFNNGDASYVTDNISLRKVPAELSLEEIRERMSGNICRCGAYTNIVAAIREVHGGKEVAQAWQFAPSLSEEGRTEQS